jgi:tetratricopeptide (TPR) repeat protein
MSESWDSNFNEAQHYFQTAYEKQMQGKMDEAIELYQKSLALYPTAEAYTFLGWAYSFQDRYDEAIEECKKAIELDPDFGNPYNDIGAYLIEQKKWDEAIPWLEKATTAKRYESYCYPLYNLGRVWEEKGQWMQAFEYYDAALRDNPDYTLAKKALGRLSQIIS